MAAAEQATQGDMAHQPIGQPMSESELAQTVQWEIANGLGGSIEDSELTRNWTKALNYFFGRPRGDEVDGRSQVISTDLADVVEQTLAEIMPAFASPDLAEFAALDEDDEDQAQDESDAINYMVLEKCPGFINLEQAIKDAMLQRTGIIKVYVDECVEVTGESHEGLDALTLTQVMQPKQQGEEVEVVSQEATYQTRMQVDPMTGAGYEEEVEVFTVELKRSVIKRELRVDPVPPEEFVVNGDHNSPFLRDARFVCHQKPVTESELIARGYDPELVKTLPTHDTAVEEEDRARSRSEAEHEFDSAHRSGRTIIINESYYNIDFDGDGIAERRKVVTAGNAILLENEYHPYVPFSGGSAFLMPHRFHGISYYDKVRQTQDIKTGFLRKTLDSAEQAIVPRKKAIPGRVNFDDLLSNRIGGVVRMKSLDSADEFPTRDATDVGLKMLDYMDKVRREAVGASLEHGTQSNSPVQNAGAFGLDRWMTAQELLTGLVARNFAETLVQGVFLLAHRVVREDMPEAMKFKTGKNWKEANPQQWLPRDKVSVHIGLSRSERQQRIQMLEMVIQKQQLAIEKAGPGVLADYTGIYRALIDQLKAGNLNNPEQYYIDPASPEGQQAQQQNAQNAQQQQQVMQQQVQQTMMLQQSIEQMKQESAMMKTQLDYQIRANEQLRKWVETELTHDVDIPQQGTGT